MKKEFKRTYILGCTGSGKNSVAQEIARKLHIQHYDLDDLFWKKKYTIKRDEPACRSMLQKVAKKDQWIIEGVYNRWVDPAFKRATFVIWLDISPWVISYRLIRRHLLRRKKNLGKIQLHLYAMCGNTRKKISHQDLAVIKSLLRNMG